jgi:hypothetical protein
MGIRSTLRDENNYRTIPVQTHTTVWVYDSTLETYTRFDVVAAGIVHVIVFIVFAAWHWFVQASQRNALPPSSGKPPLLTLKSRVLEKL